MANQPPPARDELVGEYLEKLLYPPYPVQEDAIFAWFSSEQGVLLCAPTGTGKTLVAEAAVYEALRTGKQCYYTTPLIALTDQKLTELQATVERWGFPRSSVGLVTGNRKVNPTAPVLVVVAEILLNRLLHREAFDFSQVHSVVMDEFHSFNDAERGIVWELSLALLPSHVRTLLLSATVGNSVEFCMWLSRQHQRRLELIQSSERKVPLSFWWIDDDYLDELLEKMVEGTEVARRTPTLLFCFNRDQCWQVAELLKGKKLIDKVRQAELAKRLEAYDLQHGAGPKLKQILQRGVGVHHAGILPKFRRIVEDLFQDKLLSVAVCTETLSAGINLPARSVVLPTILKGPRDKKTLIEASTAHQIFGRAGRPQFDSEGFVYALAHEDDVKYARWKRKYDQIPEDTKDPGLLRAKKQLKKKMPKRREGETYWTQAQFEKLRQAAPAKLVSQGSIPWRFLAYMLSQSPEVQPLRDFVGRRLLDAAHLEKANLHLNQMLVTLWTAGYLELQPKPQPKAAAASGAPTESKKKAETRGMLEAAGIVRYREEPKGTPQASTENEGGSDEEDETRRLEAFDDDEDTPATAATVAIPVDRGFELKEYRPQTATPTAELSKILALRSLNPLYGVFLAGHLVIADQNERIQALESVLELPANVARLVRVPPPDVMPPGPLATTRIDHQLLELGLASIEELTGRREQEEEEEDIEGLASGRRPERRMFDEPPPRALALGEKLRRLFDYDFPGVHDVSTRSVWVVGELLEFGGKFHEFIRARGLQKQEGILFRHVLRFILLLDEMACIPPETSTVENWEDPLDDLIEILSACCREVDAESTEEILQSGLGGDELLIGQRISRRT